MKLQLHIFIFKENQVVFQKIYSNSQRTSQKFSEIKSEFPKVSKRFKTKYKYIRRHRKQNAFKDSKFPKYANAET